MNAHFWTGVGLGVAFLTAGCAERFSESAYERFTLRQGYASARPSASMSRPGESSPGPQFSENVVLSDCLAYAALHSPELESAFAGWKAARERIAQVKALPDPRITYRNYVESIETRVGPQRNAVELSQTIPWPGKLRLRGEIADKQAQSAFYRFQATHFKLMYRVQQAYAEYYYLGQATTLAEENVELLNQIESIARRRYAVGADSHPDVIRAQIEQVKLTDRLQSLQALRGAALARLNAAMNRPIDAPLPWPKEIPYSDSDFQDEQLIAWASESNPEVQSLEHDIAARRQGIDLARQDYWPDITLGINWIDTARRSMPMDDNGEDAVLATVSLNIPLWRGKYAAGVREARWRYLKAVDDKAALLNTLSPDMKMALFKFQDAGRKASLYRDTLIPKAEQALQAAQTAYIAGKSDFQDYLETQRVLLEFQLSYERALANRSQRMIELEMLVGKPLAFSSE